MQAPSIDCMLMVARLRYLGRLVRLQLPTLVALLHVQKDGKRLPWIDLVASDCDKLIELGAVSGLGTFLGDPGHWLEVIKSESWEKIVDGI
eukprot:6365676-Karenia_brevis.AAC.1